MIEMPTHVVIRRRTPLARLLVVIAGSMLAVLVLYGIYELGRFDGGYDRQAAAQQRVEYEVALQKAEDTARQLRTRLAELDTVSVGQKQERADLARTIGELQGQVARQSQELAFYRSVVSSDTSGSASELGLKIVQLRITPADRADLYHVHLTLVEAGHPDTSMSGALTLAVEGQSQGSAATLDFPALTSGKLHEHSFTFRYFQSFDEEVLVPAAFRPERLTVQVRSTRKTDAPLTQTFPWRVDTL